MFSVQILEWTTHFLTKCLGIYLDDPGSLCMNSLTAWVRNKRFWLLMYGTIHIFEQSFAIKLWKQSLVITSRENTLMLEMTHISTTQRVKGSFSHRAGKNMKFPPLDMWNDQNLRQFIKKRQKYEACRMWLKVTTAAAYRKRFSCPWLLN